MSTENDEIRLAHDEYVESNKINVDDLPNELVAKYSELDKIIDTYNEDPDADKQKDIEKASLDLKNEIEAWHTTKPAEPIVAPEPIVTPVVVTTEPIVTPTPVDNNEEDNDWSYTKFLK